MEGDAQRLLVRFMNNDNDDHHSLLHDAYLLDEIEFLPPSYLDIFCLRGQVCILRCVAALGVNLVSKTA